MDLPLESNLEKNIRGTFVALPYTAKTQRIRDPIHDLIIFDKEDKLDQLAWRLLNTREFQRLRRIRQLGFSELVYPGATHTRFSHSVGVFHTARRLLGILRKSLDSEYDKDKAEVAVCAALLHDIGHGPFSHAFENVMKNKALKDHDGYKKKHEELTVDIIRDDTEVREILREYDDEFGTNFVQDVGDLLKAKDPSDVYASIVSSQFDADRLDYVRRDRYMTGTQTGYIDFEWLLDCIASKDVTVGLGEEADISAQPALFLTEKGLQAAEGYLLSRFHLYSQVYMHKTTRAAEKMLTALLGQVAQCVKEGRTKNTGLTETHPLVLFFTDDHNMLTNYLALDDMVLWSSFGSMAAADDEIVSEFARRLRDRRLFKCFDLAARAGDNGGESYMGFRARLAKLFADGALREGIDVLEDRFYVSAYGTHTSEDEGALQRVLIRKHRDAKPVDIVERSDVVKGIKDVKHHRFYARDDAIYQQLEDIWRESNQ